MSGKFIALGGAHWDILGRADQSMALHDDVGGHIRRLIGGVAGPIAMKIGQNGGDITLICYAGQDELGDALLTKLAEYNVKTHHALRADLPTDVYMGIEAPNGLIAAIAHCHSLEAVSLEAVNALLDLSTDADFVIVDGNLSQTALTHLAEAPLKAQKLTLVPASPGKIDRFKSFIGKNPAQLIVNLREAQLLMCQDFKNSEDAARALVAMGFSSALVTNSAQPASFCDDAQCVSALPPPVEVKRFTGAGDTLAGHFLFAQTRGHSPEAALKAALKATSDFISHEDKDA